MTNPRAEVHGARANTLEDAIEAASAQVIGVVVARLLIVDQVATSGIAPAPTMTEARSSAFIPPRRRCGNVGGTATVCWL